MGLFADSRGNWFGIQKKEAHRPFFGLEILYEYKSLFQPHVFICIEHECHPRK
jgi:hypothetical protein